MKKILLSFTALAAAASMAQTDTYSAHENAWISNYDESLTAIREETSMGSGGGTVVYSSLDAPANVTSVCYINEEIYISSSGFSDTVGGRTPETPVDNNYIFKLTTLPEEALTASETALTGAIGIMINGTPFYGLNDAQSWKVSQNDNSYGGDGFWNQEAYYSEGSTLDSRYSAHTPPSGDYHSHAAPYRLYEGYSSSVHSPIIGWANDGFPIYGPYGYVDSLNVGAVTLMVSGYSLRSITERTTFPNDPNDPNVLPAALQGPDVSTSYPLGMYMEDYEWNSSTGTLDEHNGRFCVTPEFPGGIYAYFITQEDVTGTPQYPHVIGTTFYGTPNDGNISGANHTIPGGATCLENTATGIVEYVVDAFEVYPNPASNLMNVSVSGEYKLELLSPKGVVVKTLEGSSNGQVEVPLNGFELGAYTLKVWNGDILSVSKVIISE